MRWLQFNALLVFVLFLSACNAPENAPYETKMTILKPWDNQEDGKPVFTSLNTHVYLSYLLADNALIEASNLYAGKARFKLILNGIDITSMQRHALCGSEVFSDGYKAPAPTSTDAVFCQSRLESLKSEGHHLKSIGYSDGFIVRSVGSGGKIEFPDLQSLESALITGKNTLTLQPVPEGAAPYSIEFIYYGQGPILSVEPVTLHNDWVDTLTINVSGDASIKKTMGANGLPIYSMKFFDGDRKRIPDNQIHIPEDFGKGNNQIQVTLDRPAELHKEGRKTAHLYYELTDSAGNVQEGGFLLPGYKLKEFMGLQLNQSLFNAFEPVFNPMINSIATSFISIFSLLNLDGFDAVDTTKPVEIGDYIYPNYKNQLAETAGFRDIACEELLTNTLPVKGTKFCAFYATIDPVEQGEELSVNVVFDDVGDDTHDPKLAFDIVIPKLTVNINVTAFDDVSDDGERYKGRYLGSYKTSVNFKDLALRDTLDLSVDDMYLIAGLNQSEGYTMRSSSNLIQKLREIILSDPKSAPVLSNSECDVCVVPANFIELAANFGGLASKFGIIGTMEEGLNEIFPVIISALIADFPDVGDIKKATLDNQADQVVDTDVAYSLVRNVTAESIGVKDMNAILGQGFAPDTAGMLRLSGGYQVQDLATNMLADQQYVTPFVDANKFHDLNVFNWGRYIFEDNEEKTNLHKEQLDMVVAISANALNQYVSSHFQVDHLEGWLTEKFIVDTTSSDKKIETLSLMVRRFEGVVNQGDEVRLAFDLTSPPQISFVGGKESMWSYSYDLLFGLLQGGVSDSQVTPAIKISFNRAQVTLDNLTGNAGRIFDVQTDFSVEANITFENGIPKLYVKTPQAPRAQFEDAAERRLAKRLVVDIDQVNYIHPSIPMSNELLAEIDAGVPRNKQDSRIKVLISSAFVSEYQKQINNGYDPVSGVEHFFDDLMSDYLRDNFSKIVTFSDDPVSIYLGTEEQKQKKIVDNAPDLQYTFSQLFGDYPLLVRGNTKWFTVDESGAWLNLGIDFTSEKLARKAACPRSSDGLPLDPFTLCFE